MANLRDDMPTTAAWVDELRKAFGTEMVNKQIKKSLKGEATFYANENGHEVGVQHKPRGQWVTPYLPPKLTKKADK